MSDLKKTIAGLSPERRALLEAMLRARGGNVGASVLEVIPRRSGDGPIPLSFGQQRLWFLDQLTPGKPFYNEPLLMFRLRGTLKREALQRAFDEVVRRHESLRTSFPSFEGTPRQMIHTAASVPIAYIDLRGCSPQEREAEFEQLAAREAAYSFDLARGPLLHVSLVRMAEEETIFVLACHHIITDGWSNRIFIRELVMLYNAFSNGAPSPLPELPIQYADFAIWQRRQLGGERFEQSIAYWKRQLGGDLPVLELPTDYPRLAVKTSGGTLYRRTIPADLSMALKELSKAEAVTLFMTLFAVFVTLLHRLTGQNDITVGAPISTRSRREIENLIGFFVNTLVLRVDISGNPTFRELLGRVKQVATEAYKHQDVPFERLVEALRPERSLSRQALFQVMFTFHNYPEESIELPNYATAHGPAGPGLNISNMDDGGNDAKFDFALALSDLKENGLAARIEYSTDLFNAGSIVRIMDRFSALMRSAASNPDTRLNALSMYADAAAEASATDVSPEELYLQKLRSVKRKRRSASLPES